MLFLALIIKCQELHKGLYSHQVCLQLATLNFKLYHCIHVLLFLTQVIEELRKLKAYIEKELGEPSNIVGVGLASRKHLCINPEVRTPADELRSCQISSGPLKYSFPSKVCVLSKRKTNVAPNSRSYAQVSYSVSVVYFHFPNFSYS